MKICVVGSGYVGLVAGACFADVGNTVVCADIDARKIEMLKRNELPIYEPGLDEIVIRNQADGRLSFTTDVAAAIRQSKVIFIAVGTPMTDEGAADLKYVEAVAETIGDNLTTFKVIVDKSTVPVGTADLVTRIIASRTTAEFAVVSNPEFLKEGVAVSDFLRPDRVVIGTDDARAKELMAQLYAPFQRASNRIIFMDARSAEMTKYAANAMLATRISFMNEIARLCEETGADAEMVRHGIGSDARIGNKFLYPGVGFGGSCFPKDVRAVIHTAHRKGQRMRILEAVMEVNEDQKLRIVDRVVEQFGEDLTGRTFGVWGLAFKPETDDMREAPSITIIKNLLARGAKVRATDRAAFETAHACFGDTIDYVKDEYDVLDGADALIVVTEWKEFRNPDFDRIKELLKQPVIFDGRNLYDPAFMRAQGFTHFSIGRVAPTKPL
ncbi:MAG: UDP-glucose/GDP-mannose dehydrogenase family protein [Deltaproteobacteria bacterium]|nr:UDP-glucose/GDP-mannose dehydrogenase family protein [Deltaproteobacteria bacterium]